MAAKAACLTCLIIIIIIIRNRSVLCYEVITSEVLGPGSVLVSNESSKAHEHMTQCSRNIRQLTSVRNSLREQQSRFMLTTYITPSSNEFHRFHLHRSCKVHRFCSLCQHCTISVGWLGSRVVSVLDSGAERPGFKSQSRRCRVTVLGKLFTPILPLFTK